jgi:hypothetical protein
MHGLYLLFASARRAPSGSGDLPWMVCFPRAAGKYPLAEQYRHSCRRIARLRTALAAGEALIALTIAIPPTGRYRSSSDLFVRIVAFFMSVFVLQTGGRRQRIGADACRTNGDLNFIAAPT